MSDKLFLDLRDPNFEKKMQPLIEAINDESPLPCALLCAAYLDKCLKGMVETILIKGSETAKDLMKDDIGILGSLFSRARLLYLLGYLHRPLFENIQKIGQIRNAFAHHHEQLTFDSEDIIDLCGNLKIAEPFTIIGEMDDAAKQELDKQRSAPRSKFTHVTIISLLELIFISRALKSP